MSDDSVLTNECACGDHANCVDIDANCCECNCHLDLEPLYDEPSHDDSVRCCPDCERPNQFGELCAECARETGEQSYA